MNGDKPAQPTPEPAPSQPESPWQYQPQDDGINDSGLSPLDPADDSTQSAPTALDEVEWTASEFIAHPKELSWFIALALVATAINVVIFLWTRDVFTAIIIPIMAILFGIIAARKPRVMNYRINTNGLMIGEKFYPYNEFKSFAVMDDGAFASIMFLPLKRFMPSMSVYYEPNDEQRIIAVLSQHLPVEQHEHDMVDRLSRRIRF